MIKENGSASGDSLATKLDNELDTEQPDNDNNLNVEKELRDSECETKCDTTTCDSTEKNTNSNNSVAKDTKNGEAVQSLLPNGETVSSTCKDTESVSGSSSAGPCSSSSSREPEAGGSGSSSSAGSSGAEVIRATDCHYHC